MAVAPAQAAVAVVAPVLPVGLPFPEVVRALALAPEAEAALGLEPEVEEAVLDLAAEASVLQVVSSAPEVVAVVVPVHPVVGRVRSVLSVEEVRACCQVMVAVAEPVPGQGQSAPQVLPVAVIPWLACPVPRPLS